MDAESPLEAAKRLVRAVARAFYDDAAVAVLDALLRDRHLRDADMDQRMGGLSHKMVGGLKCWMLEIRDCGAPCLTGAWVHHRSTTNRCAACWGSCWRSGS